MIRMDIPVPIGPIVAEAGVRGQSAGQADFGDWMQRSGAAGAGAAPVSREHADPAGVQASLVLEVSVSDAEGHLQRLVLPWQLVAGPGLSWRSAGQAALPAATMVDNTATPVDVASRGAGAIGRESAPAVPVAGTSAGPHGPAVASRMPSTVEGSGFIATDASAAPERPAGIASFAARMIRCFEREGEGLAVRIRDFGLDATAERQAVRMIRQELAESGFRLGRIVINSREVWRA